MNTSASSAAARRLWAERRWDEALDAFDEALAQEPENRELLVDAARAFGHRHRFVRTRQLLERMLFACGGAGDPVWEARAAETYRQLSRLPLAAAHYANACANRATAAPEHLLALAVLCERLHRTDEAETYLDRACQNRVPGAGALILRGKLSRRRRRFQAAEAALLKAAQLATATPDERAEAWSELAQTRDAQGDYDRAMEAAVNAKQQMLTRDRDERATSDTVLGRFRQLHDNLTQEQLKRWLAQSEPNAAHPGLALMAGFPRSGTTLIEQALDAHPALVSSEERDIVGFESFPALAGAVPDRSGVADLLDRVPLADLAANQQRYFAYNEDWLGEPLGTRLLLDKNPGSTLLLPVYLRLFPRLRTLIALRDPRDVVLSCFLTYMPLNPLSVHYLTLERAARKYALDMSAWLGMREIWPLPWLEIRYEDTVASVEEQARRAVEFLGLPWDDRVAAFQSRVGKVVLSPTYQAVTQPVTAKAVGRWKNYADFLEPVMPILEPVMRGLGYR